MYARDGGLTVADRARIAKDVGELKELRAHGVRGQETRGPLFDTKRPADAEAAQIFVPITMDEKGWERIAPAVDSMRALTGGGTGGLAVHVTGPGGTSADFSEAFEGLDSTLLLAEGLSNADSFTDKPDSIVGQEVQAEYFDAGSGDPLVIVANEGQGDEVRDAVARTRGVVPSSIVVPPGTKPAYEGKVLFEVTTS